MRLHILLGLLLLGSMMYCHADEIIEDEDEIESDDSDGVLEAEEDDSTPLRAKIVYQRPVPLEKTHFNEPFDTRAEYLKRWVLSQAKKDGAEAELAKYDGKWSVEEPEDNPILNDLGLVLKSKAKHHAVSAKLDHLFQFTDKPLIVQYEVRFQNGMDCGGAYMKLLSKPASGPLNLKAFTDKTPYTIMFGPDKCGNDHKLHFIFRHKNPITGEYEEKHAEKPTAKLDSYFSDRKTHLYTLIVRPDNTYEIKVDNSIISSGHLLKNMSPPVNPPKEIADPDDKKPADWDVREKIPDPDAEKPIDWDESEPATIVDTNAVKPEGWLEDEEVYIADPSAVKPDDWDEEMDGEWEAPRIDNPKCSGAPGCGKWEPPTTANPKYKGTWRAPMIDNPNYKGEWKPRIIQNPNFFEDNEPFKMTPIAAIGLELWSMSNDILFDNFLVSDNESVVDDFTAITWELKSAQERASSSGGVMQAIKDATNERPWLWAVFILVVVLPIVLIITYCCSGSSKPEDIAAHKKKFDDITPDTIPEEGEDELNKEEAEDKGARGDGQGVKGDGKDVKKDEPENKGAGDGQESDTEDDEEDDETEIITKDDIAEEESPKKSSSPRRRRARKE